MATVVKEDTWTARRVNRTAVITMVVMVFAWSVDYIDRFSMGMALPMIGAEFDLSKTEQGWLVTVFALVYMVCQIPAGFLADRYGSRGPMLVTLLLWSAFTAMTGMAGTFGALLVIRGLFGVCQGLFPAASFKAIAERTTPANRATVTGVMLSAGGIGAGLAPLIVGPLLMAVGWRHTFFWMAGVGALIGVVVWAILPKALPESLSSLPRDEVRTPEVSRKQVLKSPVIWKFTLLFCVTNMLNYGMITWVPSYLLEARGLSLSQTGVLAAIPMLVSIGTTILGGWLFDRYFHDRGRWYLGPIALVTAVLLTLMVTADSTAEFTLYETLALAVFGMATMAVFGLPLKVLPTAVTGIGMGVMNFGGQVAGAVAPVAMGWLADAFSYAAAFGFLIGTTLIAAAMAFWVPQTPAQFTFSPASPSKGVS
ncbi:MFS transporter [Kibdelosporangium phytohabitans]|uniref:MFS transporter n=1 Tax=Kibdelosporangium phytohabitans TaxID=860235 RepID=A0A0N7F3X2_9PSEU|nr:MFS transporter [Kibdelosporangium phytohabitans]ALG09823.1 MFS transporter [Kibdelosporangium phytohabitans]MBE1468789.1 sugar phosphate permease [Kibdelosporangium phytohabitans]